MMTKRSRLLPLWLIFAAAIASLLTARPACAQNSPVSAAQPMPGTTTPAMPETAAPAQASPAKAPAAGPAKANQFSPIELRVGPFAPPPQLPDRALAYYHLALASIYEESASADGRPEDVTRAIEEYKLALNADPASPRLNNALADLYFHAGRTREAESTARELLKSTPDDIDAHRLLGRIYLRQLSEEENAPSAAAGNVLDKAVAEFEKIVALQPKSVEDRMVLGQLYTVKHDAKKAEEQFKTAEAMEPASEEVVLNLARLYSESGDVVHEIKVLEAVPLADRSARMEDALGAAYEQLKQSKQAVAAYRRAAALEPGDLRTMDALAQALLDDNQLDEALSQFTALAKADPEDAGALVHIGEIQRRQGKYEEALDTVRKARKIKPDDLEAGYNEGLLLDVLGRFDEAAVVCEKMVDLTSHANGAYRDDEKNNRAIFLERLGAVYHEQNRTAEAVAVYQKLIDMGGDEAVHGYQNQVDAWRDAKQFDKAVEVSRKAVEANPKSRDLKLMLAGELADQGKLDEGVALATGLLANTDEDRQVWLALGQIYVRAHRWAEAGDAFDKAEALTSKKEDRGYLLFLRGELEERQKHYKPAVKFFRKALKIEPDSAMILNYLGYTMADKGTRLPEALKMIQKAVELEPMSGAYLDSLGWVYFRMGEYELAEQNLHQAVARDQTDPTVHDHMGELYAKTGRIRQAAAQWELSVAEFAKSAPADVDPAEVAKVKKKLESARAKLAKENTAMGQAKTE
ncbi:MAG: tetratricopeptide repeat protein [Terracidiphilus sp.]